MMFETDRVHQLRDCIVEVVALLNERLKDKVNLSLGENAPLFGSHGPLDSIALVSLIADVEEAVEERWNVAVVLATERAFSQTRSPFTKIGDLAQYTNELIEEKLCKARSL